MTDQTRRERKQKSRKHRPGNSRRFKLDDIEDGRPPKKNIRTKGPKKLNIKRLELMDIEDLREYIEETEL